MTLTPPKFNIDPEKWWLEDDPFLLGFGNFSGAWKGNLLRRHEVHGKFANHKIFSQMVVVQNGYDVPWYKTGTGKNQLKQIQEYVKFQGRLAYFFGARDDITSLYQPNGLDSRYSPNERDWNSSGYPILKIPTYH